MIILKRVKTHNLKDLTLSLPRGKLICLTGPSGSGKSSLAFDTLYLEAQRRYLEALSLNEGRLPSFPPRPPLEAAQGLPPAIALEQKLPSFSARSTVGTMSGIWDYLRVLFAELGARKCHRCQNLFEKVAPGELVDSLLLKEGEKIYILAPLFEPTARAIDFLQAQGFHRFSIDGKIVDLTEEDLPAQFESCSLLIDRLVLKKEILSRLREALRLGGSLSDGVIEIYFLKDQKSKRFTTGERCPFCGQKLSPLTPEMFSPNHPLGACPQCEGLGEIEGQPCSTCKGKKLKPESLEVFLGGKDFAAVSSLSLKEFKNFLLGLNFEGVKRKIFEGLLEEISPRLEALLALGLEGLELIRSVPHLSLGELQRLRLASLFAARLSGCLYILDEPGIGLSPPEKERVLYLLQGLIRQGNTVVVVEHDPFFITAADEVLELGPGAGEEGGELLFQGPPGELARRDDLPTGAYLSGKRKISRFRRRVEKRKLKGPFELPQKALLVLCGPSGSGKTRLLKELSRQFQGLLVTPARGKGRESIVISYIEAFRPLRELLATTREARQLGLKSSAFSFFTPEGRCPVCKGAGKHQIRVKFLPPLEIRCEECQGSRYRPEVLQVKYRGYNITEILNLTVAEALKIFAAVPALLEKLRLLEEVGLSYLRLGQELKTLSGGERQRLHLARTLWRAPEEKLLLLDVPTLGLHLRDVEQLLRLFDRLLEAGFTLVVADNHPALLLLADELWELEGGKVVFQGLPEEWLKARKPFSDFYERFRSLVKNQGGDR